MGFLIDRPRLLVLGVCAVLFFYGINQGELWRTECLRAMIAAECMREGHWLVPTLYGQPYLTKPPGMYAAIALTSWPLGEVRDWTARLPSALAATATVLLFYWYFRRQLGTRAGLIAALILPTSFMWLDKAPSAEIDMLQTAWIAAAILFFLRALEAEEQQDSSLRWWLVSLVCVAGGFLTKWTAPAFFYGTAIPLLWWRGRLRLLLGRGHLVGATLAAAIGLGWIAVAVHTVGWDEFAGTVSREALQRLSYLHHEDTIVQMDASHHRKIPAWAAVLLHPLRMGLINLPWSAFALLTLVPGFMARWNERGRRMLQAMHCWTWPNLVFWSVLPDHASRHSFPLFPGIAGLAAMVWIGWIENKSKTLLARSVSEGPPNPSLTLRASRALLVIVLVWLGIKLAFVHGWVPYRNGHRELPRGVGEQIAAVVPTGQTLFLSRLKDEGIMFYYGRPVRRLADFGQLPSSGEPSYCILEKTEWQGWTYPRPVEVLLWLCDEQRKPIVLIRVESPRMATRGLE